MDRPNKHWLIAVAIAAAVVLTIGSAATLAGHGKHGEHGEEHHEEVDVDVTSDGKVKVVVVDDDGETHTREYHIDHHGEKRAFLGVQVESTDDDSGVRIQKVVEDSPAERAGLQKGDVIVSFNGEAVDDPVSLTRAIRGLEPGESANVEILREGRSRTLSAELGERPGHHAIWFGDDENPFVFEFDEQQLHEQLGELHEHLGELKLHLPGMHGMLARKHRPLLGVQIVDTTPELREHLGGSADAGILVGKVMDDMPAQEAGMEVGDLIVAINGEPVRGSRDLRSALAEHAGETLTVDVIRDGRPMALSVFVPEPEVEQFDSGNNTWRGDPEEIEALVRKAMEAAQLGHEEAQIAMEAARAAYAEAVVDPEEIRRAQEDARAAYAEAMAIEREELQQTMEKARQEYLEAVEMAYSEDAWY
jgi:membrane-associated protease RseP (regulator of RpoE activity)